MYDIRKFDALPASPGFFADFLNLPSTQEAIGVDIGYIYESSNNDVYLAFQQSGDYVYPNYLEDLEYLLDQGIRVMYVYPAGLVFSRLTQQQPYAW